MREYEGGVFGFLPSGSISWRRVDRIRSSWSVLSEGGVVGGKRRVKEMLAES